MKKTVYLIIIILFCLVLAKKENSKVREVLIIGGGPAGLAASIEACESGARVTLIEKRESYSRQQVLFLGKSALGLLKKWKIEAPHLLITQAKNGENIGIIKIIDLEKSLLERVHQIGVKRITGEFVKADVLKKKAFIRTQEKELELSYDLIIGADGRESSLRKEFNIPLHTLGKAYGIIAFVPLIQKAMPDITDTLIVGPFFLRKITLDNASIIFMQSSQDPSMDDFIKVISQSGWMKEAEVIKKGEAKIYPGIPVYLQKAETASDRLKEVILIGDAAATASFFDGRGGNTALKEASLIGPFIKNYHLGKKKAYHEFEQEMIKLTKHLIETSLYLFKENE